MDARAFDHVIHCSNSTWIATRIYVQILHSRFLVWYVATTCWGSHAQTSTVSWILGKLFRGTRWSDRNFVWWTLDVEISRLRVSPLFMMTLRNFMWESDIGASETKDESVSESKEEMKDFALIVRICEYLVLLIICRSIILSLFRYL